MEMLDINKIVEYTNYELDLYYFLVDNYFIQKAELSERNSLDVINKQVPLILRALMHDYENINFKNGIKLAKGVLREIFFKELLTYLNPDPEIYTITYSSQEIDLNNGCDIIVYNNDLPIVGFDMKGKNFRRDLLIHEDTAIKHARRQIRQSHLPFPVLTITTDMGPFGMNMVLTKDKEHSKGLPPPYVLVKNNLEYPTDYLRLHLTRLKNELNLQQNLSNSFASEYIEQIKSFVI